MSGFYPLPMLTFRPDPQASTPVRDTPPGGWQIGDQIAVLLDGGRLCAMRLNDNREWDDGNDYVRPFLVIERWMAEGQLLAAHAPRRYDILPTQVGAVIRAAVEGEEDVVLMRWDENEVECWQSVGTVNGRQFHSADHIDSWVVLLEPPRGFTATDRL